LTTVAVVHTFHDEIPGLLHPALQDFSAGLFQTKAISTTVQAWQF